MRGMGRHSTADGSSVHPLVAEGVARRSSGTGSHRTSDEQGQRSGEIGWPAPPNKGEGLGWPGDIAPVDGGSSAVGPVRRSRRGWRWLLGARSAA
jgi:hypothetical protein